MEIEEIARQHSIKDLGMESPAYQCGFTQGVDYKAKIDIEDRFGPINHIQNVLNSIINNAETMTSGNISHHRASIKLLAEGLLNYTKKI